MLGLLRKKRNTAAPVPARNCEFGCSPIGPIFCSLCPLSGVSRWGGAIIPANKITHRVFDMDRFIQLDRGKGGKA